MLTDEQKLDLCKKEIDIVQGNIARYDRNGLQIKTWCVTGWGFLQAYALNNEKYIIALVASAMVVVYGMIELIYRRYQKRFIDRSAEIEEMLKSENLAAYKYKISESAYNINTREEILFSLKQPHFTVLYISLFIFGLILAVWIAI